LKRPVAGKTGTTNDFTDAWFLGFTPSLAAGAWIGFDEKVTLGDRETGGVAALPMWLEMMQQVYKDKPVEEFMTAPNLTTAAPQTQPSASITPPPSTEHAANTAVAAQPQTEKEPLTQ
jgi:penicillin-binding protein 1A